MSKKMLNKRSIFIGGLSAFLILATMHTAHARAIWQPQPYPSLDQRVDVVNSPFSYRGMVSLDPFTTSSHVVQSHINKGIAPVCRISGGSWDAHAPDSHHIVPSAVGYSVNGQPSKRWIDTRRLDVVGPLIKARLDQCREMGFVAVEPQDMDGHRHDTGFAIKYDEQLRFATWLARAAHDRGLTIGLSNTPDMASDLVHLYDWATVENCFSQGTCEDVSAFVEHDKAVFALERVSQKNQANTLCPAAWHMGFSATVVDKKNGRVIKNCDTFSQVSSASRKTPVTYKPSTKRR